jgi:hypothetical protein
MGEDADDGGLGANWNSNMYGNWGQKICSNHVSLVLETHVLVKLRGLWWATIFSIAVTLVSRLRDFTADEWVCWAYCVKQAQLRRVAIDQQTSEGPLCDVNQ